MKLKRIVAVALTLTMTAAMSACSSNDGTDRSDMETSGSVGFSVSTLNNPFFVTLVDGAKATAEENGVDLIVLDAGDDAAKQTSDVEDLISTNISVLIINPVDSDAAAPVVKDAIDAGIKVIVVDRVVNGVEVDCKIASDNVAGAKMATEYLLELVGKGAEVAELQGVPGASAIIDRGEGFHEVAAVKEVKMAATVAQQPEKMGITAVETAIKLMAGEMVEKSIPVEVKLITE